MASGIYSARHKLKTVLITKSFGGQMVEKAVNIENYPGFESIPGYELIEKMETQMRHKGVEVLDDAVIGIKKEGDHFVFSTEDNKKIEGKAGIIATGSEPRKLNIPGEKEYIGKGVSYCATCDGPLYNNKDVVVVGGGYAGFETALFMTAYAKKIYILECCNAVAAGKDIQEKAKQHAKIEVITSGQAKEIKGNMLVNQLIYTDLTTSQDKILNVSGIFVQAGWKPATEFVEGLLNLNDKKEIVVNFENFETSIPGLFAVGDVNNGKVKQIIVACGEGARAAIGAYDYINKKQDI